MPIRCQIEANNVVGGMRMQTEPRRGWLSPKPLPQSADEKGLIDQIERALRSERPEDDLVNLVYQWFDEGFDEAEALGVLSRYRECLQEQGREADESPVLEVISYLVGWCGPDGRIRRPP
jgi:hypothetical protein